MVPHGKGLRAAVRAQRKAQPQIPTGMIAALLRATQAVGRGELARVRNQPFDATNCPRFPVLDGYTPDWRKTAPTEIQQPNYELRRVRR